MKSSTRTTRMVWGGIVAISAISLLFVAVSPASTLSSRNPLPGERIGCGAAVGSDSREEQLLEVPAGGWEFPGAPWKLESKFVSPEAMASSLRIDCSGRGSSMEQHLCLLDLVPDLSFNLVREGPVSYRWLVFDGVEIRVYFSETDKTIFGGVSAVKVKEGWQIVIVRPKTEGSPEVADWLPMDRGELIASRTSNDGREQARLVCFPEERVFREMEIDWRDRGWKHDRLGVWSKGNESFSVTEVPSKDGQYCVQVFRLSAWN